MYGINRPGSGSALIANNTITYNTTSASLIYWFGGGGIYVTGNATDTVTLANNIVAYNKYDGIYRYQNYVTISMYKNCVYENRDINNALANYINITSYGTNFAADPKLSTPYFAWQIQIGSSCINTADTNYAPNSDIEGRPRNTPDVGCYEY